MIHKTMRSILSVLLAVLLLVTSTPLTPAFADGGAVSLQSESAEGRVLEPADDGTYLIYTADDLKEFADIVNGTHAEGINQNTSANAKLMNDIDLSEICSEEEGDSWTPIGNSEENAYTGTFNGQNFKISGLTINNSRANDQGLFGCVSGTVKDLTVSGSVSGSDHVGGVVGYNRGRVENCHNIGSVKGDNYVGGVVGYNSGSVENCHNIGSVSGDRYVGGVVGYSSGGIGASASVTNCYNTGAVSGAEEVGGVVGLNNSGDSSASVSVTNCYNTGEVSGPDSGNIRGYSYVGGVVGLNRGTVENCYNTGTISSKRNTSDVGGVVGCNGGTVDNGGTVENCYNTGTVTGPDSGSDSNVGGVVGYNIGASVTDCYFLQSTAASGIGGGKPSEPDETAVNDLNALCNALKGDTWTISENLSRPVLTSNHEDDGSEDHPYEIFTAAQLETFSDLVNDENDQTADPDAHAKLMNNIDLSSVCSADKVSWTPIGNDAHQYIGTFDGNGKTIENLYINSDTTANDQGLFGCLDQGGTVKDLTVSGSVSVSHGENVGGIVGYNFSGTVTNCAFSGSVGGIFSGSYVGGIVGYNSSGTVTNCAFSGSVSGNYVGGVVGYNNGGTVTGCIFSGSGSVSVSGGSYVGGVVGWNSSDVNVTNCYNIGSVSGSASYVGGVVGYNQSGSSVTTCYNTGSVSGVWYVGGVVGYNISSTVTGCYFLKGTAESGIGENEGSGDATAKDNTAFHSGEVAYLLQSKQADGSGQVWGQTLGGEEDSLPTLVALNPGAAQPVYKVTFKYGYEDAPADEISYSNGSVKFPDFERTGHTLTGWQNEDGQAVTEPITVTADTTFTAQWTKDTVNYTVTVSADPEAGGTVSGSGEYSEGTQVTVTATPATGYHFVNWTENGTEVSTEATFTFNATVDRNLIAIFAKNEDPTPTPTPDPTPSGPSTGDSTGWDDIRDELENAENGDQITIDMGDETKVPAEIFESLAGKDVEISFDLGDIQWSVNGADIPTDTDFTDLDLGASLGTSGIPVNVINTITGEVGTVQITLAHNGEFGFTMTLTAPLGVENSGYWANLYHYDEADEQLTFETAAEIDADGSVTIPFSHASQYAIVIDTHSHATVDVSDLFIDIAPDAWYKDAVQYAYDNGLMTGTSATTFEPEATTTRAMIVSILARLEGVTTAQAAGFADVDDNDWYATAVNWAANVGVVNGYEDNTFQPNTAITREQLAAILMNYAAYKGEDVSNRADLTSYTDQPSTWAEEAMSWAVAEGLISGVTNTELQPQGNATRAQVAAILQRFLDK